MMPEPLHSYFETRCKLVDQFNREVFEDITNGDGIYDTKCQIEVGQAISVAMSQGAHHSSGHNSRIRPCHLEHVVPHAITIVDSKHYGLMQQPNDLPLSRKRRTRCPLYPDLLAARQLQRLVRPLTISALGVLGLVPTSPATPRTWRIRV